MGNGSSAAPAKLSLDAGAEACKQKCAANPACQAFTYKKSTGECWPQLHTRTDGWQTIIKNDTVDYSFPDNHPFIERISNGKRPLFKDYRSPVNIKSITCQDCRQTQSEAEVTDSSQVNFDQLQNCIMNLEQTETTTPKAANDGGEPKAGVTPPTPSTPPTPPTPAEPATSSDDISQTTIAIIIAIIVLMCLSSMGGVGFYLYKRSSNSS